MKKIKFVAESLKESNERDYMAGDMPDDYNPDSNDVEDVDPTNAINLGMSKRVSTIIDNELLSPEFNRDILIFKNKESGETVEGKPIAKMGEGSYYLFKTQTGVKKVLTKNILIESSK